MSKTQLLNFGSEIENKKKLQEPGSSEHLRLETMAGCGVGREKLNNRGELHVDHGVIVVTILCVAFKIGSNIKGRITPK